MSIRGFLIVLVLLNIGLGLLQFMPGDPPAKMWPQVDAGVAKLVLLSEYEASQGTDATEVVIRSSGISESSLVCYGLGPFPSKSDIRKAIKRLAPDVERIRQREERATKPRGYWVYLPAVSSREKALAMARELSSLGVRDYYVVTAGERQNTVSLGLFRQQENAKRRVADIKTLGFKPRMGLRQEVLPVYFLDFAQDKKAEPQWELAIANLPDADRVEIECFADRS